MAAIFDAADWRKPDLVIVRERLQIPAQPVDDLNGDPNQKTYCSICSAVQPQVCRASGSGWQL
jgi:hypothetical protein